MLCLSLHFVFVDSWISSCCCILRVIYISWCIFLCLGVCWVYCIYFKFSLFCVSPFLSLILSVALVFIFSVFAFVFLVLCLSPPCVPFIESVSSQCLFPPSSCVRSICFLFYFACLCPVCIVFCFASSLLSVCNYCQQWSILSSSCVCQSPSDCCCIIPFAVFPCGPCFSR